MQYGAQGERTSGGLDIDASLHGRLRGAATPPAHEALLGMTARTKTSRATARAPPVCRWAAKDGVDVTERLRLRGVCLRHRRQERRGRARTTRLTSDAERRPERRGGARAGRSAATIAMSGAGASVGAGSFRVFASGRHSRRRGPAPHRGHDHRHARRGRRGRRGRGRGRGRCLCRRRGARGRGRDPRGGRRRGRSRPRPPPQEPDAA